MCIRDRAETTTIIPTVKAFQARHGLADMVVLAHAGMLSAGNDNLASHFHWYPV